VPFTSLTRTKFGVYQARLTLPSVIARQFPCIQREYRRSLKTSERAIAKYRNAILQVRFHEGIQVILDRTPFMSIEQVQNLINTTLRFNSMGNIKTGYSIEFHVDGSMKSAETDGTQQDHESMMEAMKLRQELNQQTFTSAVPPPQQYGIGSSYSKNLDKTFKQIADEYLSNNRYKWAPSTVDQRKGELRKLCALLPTICLEGFSEDLTRQLVDDLSMLPANYNTELIENGDWKASGKRAIEGGTQRKYFELYGEIIESALIGPDVESILGKVEVKTDGSGDPRQLFLDHELNTILTGCVYTGKCHQFKSRRDYMYWVPLIGLFSGMRLNEICQLHVRDVKMYQDIYYFDNNLIFFDPQVPDKTLKSKGRGGDGQRASVRLVPIHDKLIELGFIEFLNKSRSGKNSHMLFDKLTMSSVGKWYKNPSRYFGDYLIELGIKSKGKDFHALRHNFVTALTIGCYEHKTFLNDLTEKRKRIIGHALPDEVTQMYTNMREAVVPSLKEVIDLVDYNIDFKLLLP
jgi:integrase